MLLQLCSGFNEAGISSADKAITKRPFGRELRKNRYIQLNLTGIFSDVQYIVLISKSTKFSIGTYVTSSTF